MNKHDKLRSDLPDGRYCFISWDIDRTGSRLLDNICQLAAYTSNSVFSEYIMPHMDLNPFAERYHHLCVITTKRCRVLKDLKSNKFLKTKSEITALTNFIRWLEANRGDAADGVILVYHEVRKVAPAFLLEALRRYNLIDRFADVVKGFANTYDMAKMKYVKTMKSFSLKVLVKVLLNKDEDMGNAVKRAELCYELVRYLAREDLNQAGNSDIVAIEAYAVNLAKKNTLSLAAEEKELAYFKTLLVRQNTFHPVFKHFLKYNRKNRQYASQLRKKLVESNLDYDKIKSAFESGGRKSIQEILKKISTLGNVENEELLDILDCHFDPAKQAVKPKVWPKDAAQQNNKQDKNRKSNSSSVASSENVATPKNESN